MARRRKHDDQVRVGDRVIAVEPVGRLPAGSTGVVKVVDGLTWVRYWILWDSGLWTGSVSAELVVRADGYEAYKLRKLAEAEVAASRDAAVAAAAAPPPPEPAAAAPEGGAASRVPAHLLERSRAAKARKAAD